MKQNEITVSVILLAYNHHKFIRQAIESVISQECSYKFELIIGEDCSTDDTRVICLSYANKYPDLVKLILSEQNVGAIENELNCIKNSSGKYIAYLEGDDFWTDNLKLQKQVDYLESNPDVGLVHGDVNHLDQKKGKMIAAFNKTNNIDIPSGEIFEFLMKPSHSIKTMTVCFRSDLFKLHYLDNESIMTSNWKLIDISIWLMLSYYSKIHYMAEVFATYRLLPESMSRTNDLLKRHHFHRKIYDIFSYYANNYSDDKNIKHDIELSYNKIFYREAILLGDKQLAKEATLHLKKMGYHFPLLEKVKVLIMKFIENLK